VISRTVSHLLASLASITASAGVAILVVVTSAPVLVTLAVIQIEGIGRDLQWLREQKEDSLHVNPQQKTILNSYLWLLPFHHC